MNIQEMREIFIVFFLTLFCNLNAQENKQSAFAFNYNYQIPIGNLAITFGNNSSVGASYFLEKSNNIIFGIEAAYMFAASIKDPDIFENISTSQGEIIASNGQYANVNVMQRGVYSHIFSGYAFHFLENNLSGIYISNGIGYLQHQIFIDTKNQNIPHLDEEMKKGYDRFSNGLSTKFSIDYKYYNKSGKFQISTGINYIMAYIQNTRSYDFANNKYYSSEKKWDQLLGFNFEIIIPIHKPNQDEFHYY